MTDQPKSESPDFVLHNPLCLGIGGRIKSESVAALRRNGERVRLASGVEVTDRAIEKFIETG